MAQIHDWYTDRDTQWPHIRFGNLSPGPLVMADMIHDEVIVESSIEESEAVKELVEQAMIDGMKTFIQTVPITAEATISHSWAVKWGLDRDTDF